MSFETQPGPSDGTHNGNEKKQDMKFSALVTKVHTHVQCKESADARHVRTAFEVRNEDRGNQKHDAGGKYAEDDFNGCGAAAEVVGGGNHAGRAYDVGVDAFFAIH